MNRLLAPTVPSIILVACAAMCGVEARAAAPDCAAMVGTFLTKNAAEDGGFTSRSLISFADGGIALFADSGEGGEGKFAPFTDGRGAWRCVSNAEGEVRVHATTLDFTLRSEAQEAKIGRLDFDLGFDAERESIRGTATLYLIPLEADPLAPDALKDGSQFEITGERVEAP